MIGFVAGFGTTFAALPDLIAMLRRCSSAGMNPKMAAITGSFQILWVTYGVLISSRNIVMWNVIAVATNYPTLGAYIYFRPPPSEGGGHTSYHVGRASCVQNHEHFVFGLFAGDGGLTSRLPMIRMVRSSTLTASMIERI
jgi:MtN3 and saliva related transmembrane protein